MVNEERLRHMIKIAQFDTNEGKACRPMTQYARTDYVALHLAAGFVAGTICFGVLAVLWGLYSMEELLQTINSMDIQWFLKSLLFRYAIFMVSYLGVTGLVFNVKYTRGRRKVKEYFRRLKKVNQMYEREERLKTTGNGEWE